MEMVKAKLNGEYIMMLPKHRAARPEWYTEEGWEKIRLHSLIEHIKGAATQQTIFYIGAELGEMPALCAMHGARVVLFEPNGKAWPVIKATFEANAVEPVECFDGFVSDVTKDAPIMPVYRPDGWPIAVDNEITEAHGFNQLYQEADVIPQITVDEFVQRTNIQPTIITMDVEGSEGRVLRGAKKTLQELRPHLWLSIHPEFLIDNYKEYSGDVRSWVIAQGYSETYLDYKHELHTKYEPK